jgi:hypothetical protein
LYDFFGKDFFSNIYQFLSGLENELREDIPQCAFSRDDPQEEVVERLHRNFVLDEISQVATFKSTVYRILQTLGYLVTETTAIPHTGLPHYIESRVSSFAFLLGLKNYIKGWVDRIRSNVSDSDKDIISMYDTLEQITRREAIYDSLYENLRSGLLQKWFVQFSFLLDETDVDVREKQEMTYSEKLKKRDDEYYKDNLQYMIFSYNHSEIPHYHIEVYRALHDRMTNEVTRLKETIKIGRKYVKHQMKNWPNAPRYIMEKWYKKVEPWMKLLNDIEDIPLTLQTYIDNYISFRDNVAVLNESIGIQFFNRLYNYILHKIVQFDDNKNFNVMRDAKRFKIYFYKVDDVMKILWDFINRN